jgi:sigma-B regulation protein RsbU (phosphoserine phosphatase)
MARKRPGGRGSRGSGGRGGSRRPSVGVSSANLRSLSHVRRFLAERQREDLTDVEKQMLDHELGIAEEIQWNLLPQKMPQIPDYDICAYYRPSREVGGDYYDFLQIDDNHLGIIVADVSGKGIPGSLVMTMTRTLVKVYAHEAMASGMNLSAAETLKKVNGFLATDIKKGMFVTAMYAILDIQKKTLLIASAGHNPMVLWRKESNTCHQVNPNGIALGMDKGPIFNRSIKEQLVQLQPGDRFVLYTDGVPEAQNEARDEFGDKKFFYLVKQLSDKNSNEFVHLVSKTLDAHKGEADQHDDITLVSGRVYDVGETTEPTQVAQEVVR